MLAKSKRIVIKLGSSLLAEDGRVREAWLASLAQDIALLMKGGTQVIAVTSGAVALGRGVMRLGAGALELEQKQAAAACGQIALMGAWREACAGAGFSVAQLLLTADDSVSRRRYLNARATLEALLAHGVLPVINENDTVATAELRFGDNDNLSARVAQMAGADALVLFSDIDGLYTADPRKAKDAKLVEEVQALTPEIEAYAGGTAGVGTGGMVTKLQAAKIALSAGCHMAIARGTELHPLKTLAANGRATWFIASQSPGNARRHWIAGFTHTAGAYVVDAGAAEALKGGKSLLPAGVTRVAGSFERGDIVLIEDANGRILGRGITAYSSQDAGRILGRKSHEVEAVLGFKGRSALIHRDDMATE